MHHITKTPSRPVMSTSHEIKTPNKLFQAFSTTFVLGSGKEQDPFTNKLLT